VVVEFREKFAANMPATQIFDIKRSSLKELFEAEVKDDSK
jgi:hypothetical protein